MLSLIKSFYLIILFLFQIAISVCIGFSFRRKSVLNTSLSNFLIVSNIFLIFYLGTLIIDNYNLAYIFQSLYHATQSWFLLFFLLYVMALSGKVVTAKSAKIFRIAYIILAGLDSLIFVFGITNNLTFSMEAYYVNGTFFCWIINYAPFFLFHVSLCVLIILVILLELIYRISSIAKMYTFKYLYIFISFSVLVILNTLFLIFNKYIKLDYSSLLFGANVISIHLFSQYRIPKKLESELLSLVSQNISNPVICFNKEGECIYKNLKAEKLLNTPEILDWCKSVADKDFDLSMKHEVFRVLNDNGEYEDKIYNVDFKWLKTKKDSVIGNVLVFEDVTREVETTKREEYRAQRDSLTGLYNRNYFFETIESVIKANPDTPRYLICTNISQFKIINDLFGVDFGDSLLIKQAQILRLCLRSRNCVVGRISSDKFAILLNKDDFSVDFAKRNNDIISTLLKGKNYKLHIDIGIYEIVNPYEPVNTMYDKALLAIKNNNQNYSNILSFYDSSLMTKLLNEKNIINEFQQALEANQISMFLQAQIDAKTGKCVGAEALTRWNHPEKGLLNPDKFVGILEEAGLVYHLDYYIWKKAVQKVSEWQSRGYDLYISVNISPKDFYYADLYKELTELVEFYHISPSKINLEITESILFDKKNVQSKVLEKLKNYGFYIEMDDFGSGFSSFMTLKDMRMDVLKVDKEFLQETEISQRSKKIFITIIKMAKRMGMKVITEGVETENQKQFLTEAGCDVLQGYYFSRPISVVDFEDKYLEDDNA